MSTETRRLVRTDSPGRPPWLSHSSWTVTQTQIHTDIHRWADTNTQVFYVKFIYFQIFASKMSSNREFVFLKQGKKCLSGSMQCAGKVDESLALREHTLRLHPKMMRWGAGNSWHQCFQQQTYRQKTYSAVHMQPSIHTLHISDWEEEYTAYIFSRVKETQLLLLLLIAFI